MTSETVSDQERPISLVLIEDNRLIRHGILALIRDQPDLNIIAAPTSVTKALKRVREARPRVVLLDCGLAGHNCVRVTATVHEQVPEARIVGMGLLPLEEDVADLVKAGASGFIMKSAPVGEVLTTIRAVARGVDVAPPELTPSLFTHVARAVVGQARPGMMDAVRLTRRELQVINLAGDGQSNDEIALVLDLPVHAIRSHMQNILDKLALRARLEARTPTHGRRVAVG
jgi:DNA-binding NarL/FixJ family response regulator